MEKNDFKKNNDYKGVVIASIGQVDSSKSSTLACLTYDILDNGNGSARNKVAKHPHELQYGRTSDTNAIFFRNKSGNMINYVDLCGHRKYFKSTLTGLTNEFLDYAMLTIAANNGINRIGKQHLLTAIMLKLKIFIVITKIDICPPNILKQTLKQLEKIFGNKRIKRKLVFVNEKIDLKKIGNRFMNNKNICPFFLVSNVTGKGLSRLKEFILKLKKKKYIKNKEIKLDNPTVIIKDIYKVKGLGGLVICGNVKDGNLKRNDRLSLGPFKGEFKEVILKSFHNNFREEIDGLKNGNSGCINIKSVNTKEPLKRDDILRGMLLIKTPVCYSEFLAEIEILHHPTTIGEFYEPIAHINSVRQTVIIKEIKKNKKILRTGDKSVIKLQFKYRPSFIELNSPVVLRESQLKAIGKVVKLYK